ncbi:MAG: type IV toxin-antitoxin system AbiEi family antitoxin [Pyrinomonadaceae bacterium]
MSTNLPTKINRLLNSQPPGVVFQSNWLRKQGYSLDLQRKYRANSWLTSIGNGAMIRFGDSVGYEGAIYSLQVQSDSFIHPGGRTALSLIGRAHFLELETKKITLFGAPSQAPPAWFLRNDWGVKLDYHSTNFLPPALGLSEIEHRAFSFKVSGAARALLECIYLVNGSHDLEECADLMEGLNDLRPVQVQELLEASKSVKVNRLFLYLAERSNHKWFKYLVPSEINLGSGKRSLAKDGVYVAKYQITVPRGLAL